MLTVRAEIRGTQAPVCFTVAIFHMFEPLGAFSGLVTRTLQKKNKTKKLNLMQHIIHFHRS